MRDYSWRRYDHYIASEYDVSGNLIASHLIPRPVERLRRQRLIMPAFGTFTREDGSEFPGTESVTTTIFWNQPEERQWNSHVYREGRKPQTQVRRAKNEI